MLTIRLANLLIGIQHTYPHLERQCAAYLAEGTPDFTVTVTEEMVEAELARAKDAPTPGYCESLCAYREIARLLPAYDALLFHAAVIECAGAAYAFTAKSGTGKSTHIRLWRRVYGDQVQIVNGDKPILRFSPDGRLYAYGTPWCGKEGWQRNVGVPLRAIVFLERGDTDRITDLPTSDAVLPLMNQIVLGNNPEEISMTLEMADRVLAATETKRLICTPQESAARVAYSALIGE